MYSLANIGIISRSSEDVKSFFSFFQKVEDFFKKIRFGIDKTEMLCYYI